MLETMLVSLRLCGANNDNSNDNDDNVEGGSSRTTTGKIEAMMCEGYNKRPLTYSEVTDCYCHAIVHGVELGHDLSTSTMTCK